MSPADKFTVMDESDNIKAAKGRYRVSGFDPVEANTWVEGDFLEQGLAFYVARRMTVRISLPKAQHVETAVKYLVSDDQGNILGDGFESQQVVGAPAERTVVQDGLVGSGQGLSSGPSRVLLPVLLPLVAFPRLSRGGLEWPS